MEAFNVYVAPFPLAGGPVALSKDTQAIPVRRVSRDAGTDLHWLDDDTVRWMIGPEVFTRSLDETFAFRPDAPDDLPEPAASGTPVGAGGADRRARGRRRVRRRPGRDDGRGPG